MKNVPASSDTSKRDCNQYYDLLYRLIEESKDISGTGIDSKSLLITMI